MLLLTAAMPLNLLAIDFDDWVDVERLVREAVEAERARQQAIIDQLRDQIDNAGEGNVQLVSPHNITAEPGDEREITVTVRNVGSRPVRNLFTLAVPAAGAPFTVEFLRNSNSVSQIGANSQRTMTMLIVVDENADPGSYDLSLNHFFRDDIGETATSTDRINIRIGGEDEGEPTLEIRNMSAPAAQISPGQTATISFELRNTGDAEARNVSIVANTADVIDPMTQSEISIPVLAAGESRTLSFGFSATEDASTRTYNIRFTVSYRADDATRTFDQVAPLAVYNPDDDDDALPTLEIRNMNAPTGRINVDQTGHISFSLHNTGDVEVRNIRVAASVPEGANAVVPMGTTNMQVIPSIAPGASHDVSFGFSPTSSAITRSYAVRFYTTFQLVGRAGENFSFEQFAAFNVYNPDDDDDDDARQIPRVIISDSVVYPSVPRAGQEFEMTITFRNTNATRPVNNIRILMEEVRAQNLPGHQQQEHFAGFNPVGGSNTLFIDRLSPREEITKNLRFITSADATPGIHNMRFEFDFQDDNFREHKSTEQISMQLAQVMRMELTDVNVSDHVMAGGSVWFSFRVINSGRVNLLSTRVRTEGPDDVSEAGGEEGMFIGTINAQRWSNFEGRFDAPHDPGEHQFEFVITAEDNTGEPIELRHPFTLFVEGGWDGGGFDGGWGDDFHGGGGRPFPGDGGWGDGMGMGGWEEPSERGAIANLVRNIFTRPIAPEWWDSEFMGDFTAESAAMHGIDFEQADRGINWFVVIIPGVVLLAILAIPITILLVRRSKRRKRLLFDDDDA